MFNRLPRLTPELFVLLGLLASASACEEGTSTGFSDAEIETGGSEAGEGSSIGGQLASGGAGGETDPLNAGGQILSGGVPGTGGIAAIGGTPGAGGLPEPASGGSESSVGGGQSESGGAAELVPAEIEKDTESLIALSGLQVVSYGGYLNGESFQQDAIITHNGYQYSSFWNQSRNVVLARRELPDGEWEKFDFTDYANSEDDAHNTISLGICPEDGTLHIAFDHHGSPLHYRRSVPGLTTSPQAVPWGAASFTPVTSALKEGEPVTLVTYPRFVAVPGGHGLLLSARIGSSGSGDEFLWEYSASTESWTAHGKFIDGITDSINAYLHGLAYTRGASRLHIAWCWRETPDPQTNHDLFYAYSDDDGQTWYENTGELIATTGTTPITRDSAGAKVFTIGQNRGLINQEHMTVDAAGRVHVLLSHLPDSEGDDSNFVSSRTKSEFYHYFRDTDGTWIRRQLRQSVKENFRGSLAVASSGNLYAVLPDLRLMGASLASKYDDWTLLISGEPGRFFSDPLVDATRLLNEDKLTVYYPQASSPNIWALDYTLR